MDHPRVGGSPRSAWGRGFNGTVLGRGQGDTSVGPTTTEGPGLPGRLTPSQGLRGPGTHTHPRQWPRRPPLSHPPPSVEPRVRHRAVLTTTPFVPPPPTPRSWDPNWTPHNRLLSGFRSGPGARLIDTDTLVVGHTRGDTSRLCTPTPVGSRRYPGLSDPEAQSHTLGHQRVETAPTHRQTPCTHRSPARSRLVGSALYLCRVKRTDVSDAGRVSEHFDLGYPEAPGEAVWGTRVLVFGCDFPL